MLEVTGVYYKGNVRLDNDIKLDGPVRIVVTFPDNVTLVQQDHDLLDNLRLNDFSFKESRRLLKDMKISVSNAVVEARRSLL